VFQGKALLEQEDRGGHQESNRPLQFSNRLGPSYAEAYSGLADCYVLMGIAGYGGLSTGEAMRLARAAGEKTLELDPTIGESAHIVGDCRMLDNWNWEDAEREFRLAISLKPDYPTAHYWYTTLLAFARALQRVDSQQRKGKRIGAVLVSV